MNDSFSRISAKKLSALTLSLLLPASGLPAFAQGDGSRNGESRRIQEPSMRLERPASEQGAIRDGDTDASIANELSADDAGRIERAEEDVELGRTIAAARNPASAQAGILPTTVFTPRNESVLGKSGNAAARTAVRTGRLSFIRSSIERWLGPLFDGSTDKEERRSVPMIRLRSEPPPANDPNLAPEKLRQADTVLSQPFNIVKSGGKLYIELPAAQLERDILFSASIEHGTGEKGMFAEEMNDTFAGYFRREGGMIQFMRRNTRIEAAPRTPEARALKDSFSDSIVAQLPIKGTDAKKGTLYISADDLFGGDLIDVTSRLRSAYEVPQISLKNHSDPDFKVFARNIEIGVDMHFDNPGGTSDIQDDPRVLTLGMHYSVSAMPEPGYRPRVADERVGFFTTDAFDYTRADLKTLREPLVQLINRWRLEKIDPSAAISEVKSPITYWIDRNVPEQFRPAIKAGVLAWNAVFEEIGFKNAVAVKEVDKDLTPEQLASFDPGDIAFNMITWFMANNGGFAQGPSRADPFTGELLNARIRVDDLMSRTSTNLELINAPVSLEKPVMPSIEAARLIHQTDGISRTDKSRLLDWLGNGVDSHGNYSRGIAHSAIHGLAMIDADALLSEAAKLAAKSKLLFEYLLHVTMHEVGHTLGLRHNMAASSAISSDQLGKIQTASIMDYTPIRIAGPGEEQGEYFQTRPGPYDHWAIRYGYLPIEGDEKAQLKALDEFASESSSNPVLRYGPDEDMDGINPDVMVWTLGDDVVAYGKSQTALAARMLKQLETREPSHEEGYVPLLNTFSVAFSTYFQSLFRALTVIGGVRFHRVRPGDPKPPFEGVGAQEQRDALQFLERSLDAEPFYLSPELLARLVPQRTGYNHVSPIALSERVSAWQAGALSQLFSAPRLRRILQARELAKPDENLLTLQEMMESLKKSIFREFEDQDGVNIAKLKDAAYRRSLQRMYLATLKSVYTPPSTPYAKLIAQLFGTPPPEAMTAAKRQRAEIRKMLKKILESGRELDPAVRLHLQQLTEPDSNPSAAADE